MSSGKSKSQQNRLGSRRVANGQELAPRSARKKGTRLLKDCSEEQLKKARII